MDEPLCVIRNASPGPLSRKTFNVLVFRDRLLAIRGPGALEMMRGSGHAGFEPSPGPRLQRRRFQAVHDSIDVQRQASDERVRELLRQTESELLTRSPDNRRVELADIASARLDRRRTSSRLRLRLREGDTLRWDFVRGTLGADHDRVAGVLALLLGPRLDP